jgi:GST-like protein
MTDLVRLPDHQALAGAVHPDRHAALFAADAERREGLDHAGGDLGLPYEPHLIDIGKNETWTPEFLSLNPNGKIPAIIDPDGPGGKPLGLFESGAILLYLAEKTGKLLPQDPARLRYETIQWVFFQMAAIGPMFGQLGFFHKFAGREYEDKRPRERYAARASACLACSKPRLVQKVRTWIMGERLHHRRCRERSAGCATSLASTARASSSTIPQPDPACPHLAGALALSRPAVQRGLDIPKRPA